MTSDNVNRIPQEDRDDLRDSLSKLSETQLQKMSTSLGIKEHTLKYYRDGRDYPDDLVRLRSLVHWAKVEAKTRPLPNGNSE